VKVAPKFDFLFFKKHALNILFAIVLLFILAQRLPSIIYMYGMEGREAKSAIVMDLNSQPVSFPLLSKHILVFWATWCGPCKVELARINRMVTNGEIPPDSVLAISVAEDLKTVSSFVEEQGYSFRIAIDRTGKSAALYRVSGTPTILFINQDQTVNWMTTGLSPSLEFRIRSFLSEGSNQGI